MHTSILSRPCSIFHFPLQRLPRLPRRTSSSPLLAFSLSPPLCSLQLLDSLLIRSRGDLHLKAAAVMDSNDSVASLEEGDVDDRLVVEACLTRVLPPALTLEHGLDSLKEALEELKRDPPACRSGLIRFEVAVPPSAKALNWFCCQPQSSSVFPQFYVSKESDESVRGSASLDKIHAAFGLGSAVSIRHTSSSNSSQWNNFRRFLLVDSLNVTAYGFINISDITASSFVKDEIVSVYIFIPQIELKEYEGFCYLSGTMAWCESNFNTLMEALQSFETSLFQAKQYLPLPAGTHQQNLVNSRLRAFNIVECEKMHAVFMDAQSLGSSESITGVVDMKYFLTPSNFFIRLSSTSAVATRMLDNSGDTCFCPEIHANINALWASLIVEECYRLGLTYFCVAPGSRSSPLAVAASSHRHITCIACFDERSLAFHAVGYARGSNIPAVVITTSGTAVSNLLPAVVEASQDFVPLVLLTADRPAELHEAGANQTINQVNHFGSFVRFFFNLPAPSDCITARMVLTTIDSAVYRATSVPYGPVHINCPFREPLDNSPQYWLPSCLDGLDSWIISTEPFTKYSWVHSHSCAGLSGSFAEIQELIMSAKDGLLLIGDVHTEDEIWAALILAQHLSWPVVTDILSGIRIRILCSSYCEIESMFTFIDHLDHVLLSDAARQWTKPDVVIQVGGKITSKRVAIMLEECFPYAYIMVDQHPCRHDPSHLVTHRIQSTISQFADCVLKVPFQQKNGKWTGFLERLNAMVAQEISFQIHSENSLTEPHVVHELTEFLSSDAALFIGNSMAIRDADMYCPGLLNNLAVRSDAVLPFNWIKIAGNRGASGIDGLLSTAVGFAVGCKKRVICAIGDVSFLHDTNALAILCSRMDRKPITVLVINNHGGAIFSFLPIAKRTEPRILNEYFYYSHTVSIRMLCAAHGVQHSLVKTKVDLREALSRSQQTDSDYVIEVESSIENNAAFHSVLRKHAGHMATCTLNFLSSLSIPDSYLDHLSLWKVDAMEYSLYRVQLNAAPTSVSLNSSPAKFYKEGFILALCLDDGTIGFGEVAPLEADKRNLLTVEEQLRFILHELEGARIPCFLPLLRGSFSSWIWKTLGVPLSSIFPSVRCGLEMAILNAFASRQGCSLSSILRGPRDKEGNAPHGPSGVRICALLDDQGAPLDVANIADKLVREGFRALKLKVGRRKDPREDAAIVQEIRKKVGPGIELRVDANRKWTYGQAIEFGSGVQGCNLQYIEEPVQNEDDIIKFCEETGLPVALDETIDNIQENILDVLSRFTHTGIVAIVIKPSIVGGFENAALIAKWAHVQGKLAIVSAAFESGLSLSFYAQYACYLDLQNAEILRVQGKNLAMPLAHGLGTYQWLKEDVTPKPLKMQQNACSGDLEASLEDADYLLRNFQINQNVILRSSTKERIHRYMMNLESEDFSYDIEVQEIGARGSNHTLVFLHGFLGTGEDWFPIMKAISGSMRCISVNLPGHGKSKIQYHGMKSRDEEKRISIEVVASLLCKLINDIATRKVTLVGYSMGGRIALYMALKFRAKIDGAIIISGSPGLKDMTARKVRCAKDDAKALSLFSFGLRSFIKTWYSRDLWFSLREHPSFKQLIARRMQHHDPCGLAKALSDLSIGRQPLLWDELKHCQTPLLFMVGEKDVKFKKIMQDISSELCHGANPDEEMHEVVVVPDAGHAVHLENPLAVIRLVRQFLTVINK